MSAPIRVLHLLNNLGSGGVEGLLMNIYRALDREKVQFDFMIRSAEGNRFADEVERLGGRIFIMPEFPRHAIRNYRAVDDFFRTHQEYSIIHVHANSLIYTFPLILARKHGVARRVIHSHSTNSFGGFIGRMVHRINRCFIGRWATDFLACSPDAALWMFGRRPYLPVSNGIDLEAYRYSPTVRQAIREQLGLTDELLMGHVGRFLPVKNHSFLVEVFLEVLKEQPSARLLLIGEGILPEALREKIRQEGIEDKIIMTGVVSNVHDYMSAMDAFVFPSLYEGLPLSLVEAQANGLPCLISDRIPPAAVLAEGTRVLSLQDSPRLWAETLLSHRNRLHYDAWPAFISAFDINQTAATLTKLYCSCSETH